MTIGQGTIKYLLGTALGVAVVLAPAAAADSAVLAEKENPAVMGVAAGTEAATASATPKPSQQKPRKKQKTSRFRPMMAVPLETVQGTAPAQAPAPASAPDGAGAPAGAPTPAAPQAAAATAPQQAPPSATPQQASGGTSAAPPTQPSPNAPKPAAQGAPVAAQAAPTQAAAAGTTAGTAAVASAPAGTAAEPAQTPAPAKRRLGMWTTSSKTSAPAASGEAPAIVRKDIIGIVPPLGRIAGRVLGKDGITMLGGAELVLDHQIFGSEHRIVTDSSGGFDVELPIGQYDLTIQRRHEIYESPTTYSIARRGILPIDFILLRDFEEQPAQAPTGKGSAAGGDVSRQNDVAVDEADRWLPEPRREPEVVGSVVDLVSPAQQEASGRPRKHGTETMGFLGALLAVLIAL